MKKFNINDFVKVKLTKRGREVYLDHCVFGAIKPIKTINIDVNGYTVFQLWSLMSIFGEHMVNGNDIMFDGVHILIEDRDLEEVTY